MFWFFKCIEQKTLPIKCPECGKEIRDIYIYQSLKSIDREDLLDQYENFYFDKLPNKNELITCPTIGCRYRIFLDKKLSKERLKIIRKKILNR